MTRSAIGTGQASASRGRIAKLSNRDIVHVLGELSDLLDAGCPLSRALAVMRRQATRPPVRRLLGRLETSILNGSSLAEAMAETGGHFSGVHVAMVRAAETGGFLQKTLAHMNQFGRQRMDLISRVKSAMTYPTVLLVTAMASIVFLLAFVVPRFTKVYADAGAELPWATELLISVSHFVADWWWAALAGGAIVLGLARLLSRHEPVRQRTDAFLLRIPVAGPLTHLWSLGEFTRCMTLLLDGGVPVLNSLKLSTQVMGNRAMRADVVALAEGVQQGEPMGRRMASSRLFPPATAELIQIAEESGKLPEVMARLAEQAQQKLQTRLSVLMSLVEPVIVLIVGALVALIVAAMLLPVLLMNTLVQ